MLPIGECHLLVLFPPNYTSMSAPQERDNLMAIPNSHISKNVYKSVRLNCSCVVHYFFFSFLL